MTEPEPLDPPLLRVVAGDPTSEELAAVVAVLALRRRTTSEGTGPTPPSSPWSASSRRVRPALRPGPDAWRRSALPH